jgi:hypothetical protein
VAVSSWFPRVRDAVAGEPTPAANPRAPGESLGF